MLISSKAESLEKLVMKDMMSASARSMVSVRIPAFRTKRVISQHSPPAWSPYIGNISFLYTDCIQRSRYSEGLEVRVYLLLCRVVQTARTTRQERQ